MSQRPRPAFAPKGWPSDVRPPDAPGWEQTAIKWLLDQCPPEARGYPGLRREPVVLAAWARWHTQAQVAAMRAALSQTRAAIADYVPDSVLERAILLWQREEARLVSRLREVSLVQEALHGTRFRPRL